MRINIAAHNTIEELEKEIKSRQPDRYRLRMQAILLAKQGKSGIDIQTILVISRHAYYSWIHKYNEGGLEKLKQYNRGRKEGNPKYDTKIFKEVFKKLDEMDEYWSIPKMQKLVLELHSVKVPYETMRMRVKRAGYSYKSNRPSPYKGDPELQEEFKKMQS